MAVKDILATTGGNPRACTLSSQRAPCQALSDARSAEAGFANADTVAFFLKNREFRESARDGVILVDEARQEGGESHPGHRTATETAAGAPVVSARTRSPSVVAVDIALRAADIASTGMPPREASVAAGAMPSRRRAKLPSREKTGAAVAPPV